jgi:hypothetical protein
LLTIINYYYRYYATRNRITVRSPSLQIMVHTPEDFPDISGSYKIYSEINQSSQISVSVSHIGADESIYRLGETDRKCFLYVERSAAQVNLPLYRSNSEDNCYSRCRLRTTREMCGCVPYYFDVEREGHDGNVPSSCGLELYRGTRTLLPSVQFLNTSAQLLHYSQ